MISFTWQTHTWSTCRASSLQLHALWPGPQKLYWHEAGPAGSAHGCGHCAAAFHPCCLWENCGKYMLFGNRIVLTGETEVKTSRFFCNWLKLSPFSFKDYLQTYLCSSSLWYLKWWHVYVLLHVILIWLHFHVSVSSNIFVKACPCISTLSYFVWSQVQVSVHCYDCVTTHSWVSAVWYCLRWYLHIWIPSNVCVTTHSCFSTMWYCLRWHIHIWIPSNVCVTTHSCFSTMWYCLRWHIHIWIPSNVCVTTHSCFSTMWYCLRWHIHIWIPSNVCATTHSCFSIPWYFWTQPLYMLQYPLTFVWCQPHVAIYF